MSNKARIMDLEDNPEIIHPRGYRPDLPTYGCTDGFFATRRELRALWRGVTREEHDRYLILHARNGTPH